MQADETQIQLYLKSFRGQFVSVREIARRAGGKRRFQKDPNWAGPPLHALVDKGIVESDSTGHYRLVIAKEKKSKRKWLSPQVKEILEKSGKDFTHVIREQDVHEE